jgi:predicted nucleic acid-binding protein
MLYLLDTDIQSLLEFDSPDARLLKDRLAHVPDEDIAGTIISCEERLRGWLAFLARNPSLEQQIETYTYLQRLITSFQALRILPFDASAATELRRLQAMKLRLSTMDLKIAAIYTHARSCMRCPSGHTAHPHAGTRHPDRQFIAGFSAPRHPAHPVNRQNFFSQRNVG